MNKTQISRRPKPQQTLRQLISRILGIVALLIFLLYCLIPLYQLQDIFGWLQSGGFITFTIAMIFIYVVYTMVNRTDLKLPQSRPAPTQPSKYLKYGNCDICKKSKPMYELYDVAGRVICEECINCGIDGRKN